MPRRIPLPVRLGRLDFSYFFFSQSHAKRKMHRHVVIWSAMRSGSTEFARELARAYHWTYADEPLNDRLSQYNPALLNSSNARLVFKLFPMHRAQHLQQTHGAHCIVVLERAPSSRWCSLLRAKETGDWSGRRRRGCRKEPPEWFERQHWRWMQQAPREHLYLTFENVTKSRARSVEAVDRYCNAARQATKAPSGASLSRMRTTSSS